jgi:hypothetical protein
MKNYVQTCPGMKFPTRMKNYIRTLIRNFVPSCKTFEKPACVGVIATQGCRMVYFQTKNPILGKFWRELQWNMLVHFMDSWPISRPFEIFYWHLVYLVVIWYIVPVLVCCTKKNLATPSLRVAKKCRKMLDKNLSSSSRCNDFRAKL